VENSIVKRMRTRWYEVKKISLKKGNDLRPISITVKDEF